MNALCSLGEMETKGTGDEPDGTEFLGGDGAEPKVQLYVEGASREGEIEWGVTGYAAWTGVGQTEAPYEVRRGVCPGTSKCNVPLALLECKPWELDETSCYVTVTAKTRMPGALDSPTRAWTFLITPPPPVSPPTFDPEPTSEVFIQGYDEGVPVKILCAPGTEPRYTRNGNTPTQYSTRYSGPVIVKRGVTDLQAICVRDGMLGGSGVSRTTFRVVSESSEDVGKFLVEDQSPPPTSNPPAGADIDAVSISAVELIRARALQLSSISYTTMLDGVKAGPFACRPNQRCDVPLPTSCGSASAAAATVCGGRDAVSCSWSVTATETVPNHEYILPSEPVVLAFTLSFPAVASCPVLSPAPTPLVEMQAAPPTLQTPLIVDHGNQQAVHVSCPTPHTYARFALGTSAAVGRLSNRVPASGEIEVAPGLRVVHVQCDSDEPHILPSSVAEGSFYILQRAPTPTASAASGTRFEHVFSESVEIADALSEAVVSYQISGAGGQQEQEHVCTGSHCSVVLSSSCAAAGSSNESSVDGGGGGAGGGGGGGGGTEFQSVNSLITLVQSEGGGGGGEECSYSITARATAGGFAPSHQAIFSYTLTMPPLAAAPILSPPPPAEGNASGAADAPC